MTLTRRTLLQSLAALLPLSALGLGRARNLSIPALPEPPGGGGLTDFEKPLEFFESREEQAMREVERPSLFESLSGPPGSGSVIQIHTDLSFPERRANA